MLCAGDEWVISADQPWVYRSQGVQRSNTTKVPGTQQVPFAIGGNSSFPSDWAVAAVLVYNADLSTAQITAIEDYLAASYGLTLARAIAPSPPPVPPPPAPPAPPPPVTAVPPSKQTMGSVV